MSEQDFEKLLVDKSESYYPSSECSTTVLLGHQ